MLYITSDHAGLKLKQKIVEFLNENNIRFEDVGPYQYDKDDDYPDYVVKTVIRVQQNKYNNAILICKNGVGVSMMANKFKYIRCAISWTPEHAKSSREDDDTNALALPADYIDEKTACKIVETWLNTPFSSKDRHIRRLKKVETILS